MNYREQKQELISKRNEVLKGFEILSREAFKVAARMGNLFDEIDKDEVENRLDWISFITDDEETRKFTRLVSSLNYVTRPQDEQAIDGLRENIEINARRQK